MVAIKICGITDAESLDAVASAGAGYCGFVFFEKSPRNITVAAARNLALSAPDGLAKTGLFVNPDNMALDAVLGEVPLDIIQLHGNETPARVAEIRTLTGLPVMKAVGVATRGDLSALWDYGLVADMLLVDAKPAPDAEVPGGNGIAFDWRLLVGRSFLKPWFLAGGLTPENVAEAIRLTGAMGVDVSSGVETSPSVKDPVLIQKFCDAALGR